MARHRYSVQSLNVQTNTWQEVFAPSSRKEALADAHEWERSVEAWRAKGLKHLSCGVRVVINGDQGEPLYLKTWSVP